MIYSFTLNDKDKYILRQIAAMPNQQKRSLAEAVRLRHRSIEVSVAKLRKLGLLEPYEGRYQGYCLSLKGALYLADHLSPYLLSTK